MHCRALSNELALFFIRVAAAFTFIGAMMSWL
jgi:hypothetical protein